MPIHVTHMYTLCTHMYILGGYTDQLEEFVTDKSFFSYGGKLNHSGLNREWNNLTFSTPNLRYWNNYIKKFRFWAQTLRLHCVLCFLSFTCFLRDKGLARCPVGYTCNPGYSGGRVQEDRGSKPARANSSTRPYLEKPFTKIGLVEWLKLKALSSSPSSTQKRLSLYVLQAGLKFWSSNYPPA
jgi:hypothetical protein